MQNATYINVITQLCLDLTNIIIYTLPWAALVSRAYISVFIGGGSCTQVGGVTQAKINYACKYSNNGHTL